MLAYAPRPERRRFHPAALALIAGAHAIAILAVMSAKMDLPRRIWEPPIVIDPIPNPPDPPENPPPPTDRSKPNQIDNPMAVIDPVVAEGPVVDIVPGPVDPGPIIGPAIDPVPAPTPTIVRTGPRFATPDHLLRPPYPEARRRLDQEADLKLRLTIDERGRVVAVDPVGRADPDFLEAARRHILKAWRYRPATEDGTAIASSTVITLAFRLDD